MLGFVLNIIHKFDKIITEYDKYPFFGRTICENKDTMIQEKFKRNKHRTWYLQCKDSVHQIVHGEFENYENVF